jgi:hypothetical protein
MRNRLFILLAAHQESLTVSLGRIERRVAQSEDAYFIVKPPTVYSQAFKLNDAVYDVRNVHLTIFEIQRRDEASGRSCFHVTIDIASQDTDELRIHVYFDQFGNYCYLNAKSRQNENISLGNAHTRELRFYATQYAVQFYSPIETLYQNLLVSFNSDYSKALCELENLSIDVFGKEKNVIAIRAYCNRLDELLKLLHRHKEEHAIVPDKMPLSLLERLYESAQEILSKTETIQTKDARSDLIRIGKAIASLKGVTEEASQVADLVQRLETLRLKVESLEDAYLLTTVYSQFEMLKIRALRVLTICEISPTEMTIDNEPLRELVRIAPLTFKNVYRVVQNNKLTLLALMLAQKKEGINFDLRHPSTGYGLLEEAYERKHTEALALLLDAGLNPNVRSLTGDPLLHRSCLDERVDEAALLLKYGASTLIRDVQGFTPLGVLACIEARPFNHTLFSAFMNNSHCRDNIDLMQGQNNRRSTCLSFACQFNNEAAVAALLANGANPAAIRESDYFNCLQICAWKGLISLCRLIIDKTPTDRLNSCVPAAANALNQAMKTHDTIGTHAAHARFHRSDEDLRRQRKVIAKLFADYMAAQQLGFTRSDVSFLLPQGASFSALMGLIGTGSPR